MKTKIYYIANYNGNPHRGVTKKLLGQIEALNRNGVEAKLIFLSNTGEIEIERSYIKFHKFPSPPFKSRIDKIVALLTTSKKLKYIISTIEDDAVIYFRNYFPSYGVYKLFKNTKKRIFIDVVSNTIQESKLRKSNLLYRLNLKLFGSLIANSANGIIGVTKEIIYLNFPYLEKKTPVVAISNGFDVTSVPLKPVSLYDENKIVNFICVAHISIWHGIDRFVLGLANYKNKHKVHFHLVGEGPELRNILAMINEYNLNDLFTYYGFLSGKDLDDVFSKADVAIGNLGTHRKKIEYTSPLKSKEYCSRGIPFFYTCIDEDFLNFPFKCLVPSDDSPIDFDALIRFYKEVSQQSGYNEIMRNFAMENLTWDKKMKNLVDFFNQNI